MKSQRTIKSSFYAKIAFSAFAMTFAFAAAASAASIEADFQANAMALPNRLLNHGYFQVGDLRVNDLIDSMQNIQINVTSRIVHRQDVVGDNSLRDSAQWHRGSGATISINRELWLKTKPKEKPMLALHETLGALGYTDSVYSCSGTIWLLTNETARAKLTPEEISTVEKMAEENCRSAVGGSTGVTGGGDNFGVAFKQMQMENTVKKMEQSRGAQERRETLDDMQGQLNGSDFFVDRYGISAKRAKELAKKNSGAPPYILNYAPDLSTVKVTMNFQPVPQDEKNGWTFDPSITGIRFHGRYNTTNYNEISVQYGH